MIILSVNPPNTGVSLHISYLWYVPNITKETKKYCHVSLCLPVNSRKQSGGKGGRGVTWPVGRRGATGPPGRGCIAVVAATTGGQGCQARSRIFPQRRSHLPQFDSSSGLHKQSEQISVWPLQQKQKKIKM